MDIKQLTEAFIELSESNEVELSKLQATDTPSVFDIIEDGKKVGFLEFPELEYETQEAIEEQELSYYRPVILVSITLPGVFALPY